MNIVIVGGGTAGWLAGLFVSKIRPNHKVTGIDSSVIGIIGAGEGSTGYGKRTLMAPEGAIALNDKDTVIAGTDLGGGGGGRSTGIDIGPLVAEMQNVRAILQQILAKEGSVYIDSTKAGTAFAVGASKLQ